MDILQEDMYSVQAAMEQWTDARVIPAEDLEDLLLFLLYMPRTLSQSGIRVKGFSSRQKNGQRLLTVKAFEGDTPLVAFVTSATTIGGMGRFLTLMENDRLNWTRDRFPWI